MLRAGTGLLRKDLLERLGSASDPDTPRLSLCIAPVGYGKSILLSQWAKANAGQVLSLQATDLLENSPGNETHRHPAWHALRALATRLNQNEPADAERDTLFDALRQENPISAIAIDDLDNLPPQLGPRLLDSILNSPNSPGTLRLVATSHTPIGRPLGVFGVRGQLLHLSARDLAFTRQEIARLLVASSDEWIEPEHADILLATTRGWPAGIQFALQHLVVPTEDDSQWAALDDYIATTVLGKFDQMTRRVLQAMFDITHIGAALWQEIWQRVQYVAGSADGQLPPAQPGNQFEIVTALIPMTQLTASSGLKGTFGFIPQVRDSLKRLHAHERDTTTIRDTVVSGAVKWFLDHDAFRSAMAIACSDDQWNSIFEVLVARTREFAIRDLHINIIELLGPVPRERLLENDDLAFWYAMSLLSSSEIREGGSIYGQLAAQWEQSESRLVQGRLKLLEALACIRFGNREPALAAALEAVRVLPVNAYHERFRVSATAEVLSTHMGQKKRATRMFQLTRSAREHLPWDQRWWLEFVMPNQADRVALSGKLGTAYEMFRHQLESAPEVIPEQSGLLYMRMALIQLERNDVSSALDLANRIPNPLPNTYWKWEVPLTHAKILHAAGQESRARAALYAVIREASADHNEIEVRRAKVQLAQIWLDSGDIEMAESWDVEESLSMDRWPRSIGQSIPGAVKAQLYIAQQNWPLAHAELDVLIAEGERRQQPAPLVRVHALKALAHARQNNLAACHDSIQTAIHIGTNNGFHRSYLVGTIDTRLLLSSANVIKDLADRHPMNTLPKPLPILSEREREILCLAESMTNSAIADQLFLSPNTVKNHLARIYHRLSVRNRHEAVVVATNLGLI